MHQYLFRVGPVAKATVIAGLWLLCAPRSAPAQIVGDGFSSTELSCAGLKLETAWGVPDGVEHQYKFGGSCRVYQSDGEGQQHDFPVIAEASWNSKTKKLTEGLKILGDFEYYDTHVAGSVQSIYLCSADPIIGPAACNGDAHENEIALDQFSQAFLAHKPLLAGRTTLAEATKLNQKKGSPPPPPPPPAKPKPMVRATLKPPGPVTVTTIKPKPPAADCTSVAPRRSEVPLAPGVRLLLESGRALAARAEGRDLRWAVVGQDQAILRLFPEGSRAFRSGNGDVIVDWGGGIGGPESRLDESDRLPQRRLGIPGPPRLDHMAAELQQQLCHRRMPLGKPVAIDGYPLPQQTLNLAPLALRPKRARQPEQGSGESGVGCTVHLSGAREGLPVE